MVNLNQNVNKEYSTYIKKCSVTYCIKGKGLKVIYIGSSKCDMQIYNKNKALVFYIKNIKRSKHDTIRDIFNRVVDIGYDWEPLTYNDILNNKFPSLIQYNYNKKKNILKITFYKKHVCSALIRFCNDDNIKDNGQYQTLCLKMSYADKILKPNTFISSKIWKQFTPVQLLNFSFNYSHSDNEFENKSNDWKTIFTSKYDDNDRHDFNCLTQDYAIDYFNHRDESLWNYNLPKNYEFEMVIAKQLYKVPVKEIGNLVSKYGVVDEEILKEHLGVKILTAPSFSDINSIIDNS